METALGQSAETAISMRAISQQQISIVARQSSMYQLGHMARQHAGHSWNVNWFQWRGQAVHVVGTSGFRSPEENEMVDLALCPITSDLGENVSTAHLFCTSRPIRVPTAHFRPPVINFGPCPIANGSNVVRRVSHWPERIERRSPSG